MNASPDDVANILTGIGSLLIIAEVLPAAALGGIVLIGKAIASMTQGSNKKARREEKGIYYGETTDGPREADSADL